MKGNRKYINYYPPNNIYVNVKVSITHCSCKLNIQISRDEMEDLQM